MAKAKLDHITAEPAGNVALATSRSSPLVRGAREGAATLPNPSRRGLLAGTTAALIVGAAIACQAKGAPASPGRPMPAFGPADAELLALADQFWRHDAGLDAWNTDRIPDTEGERHNEAWWNCCRAMTGIVPQTEAGRGAKATVALAALARVQDCQHDVEALARAFLAENAARPQTAPAAHPDAALIATCDSLVAVRRERRRLCIADPWAPDRGPNHARHEAMLREEDQIEESLYDLPTPVTQAGMQAVARAALAQAERSNKGEIIIRDSTDWLVWTLAEAMAGASFEAELAGLVERENRAEVRA